MVSFGDPIPVPEKKYMYVDVMASSILSYIGVSSVLLALASQRWTVVSQKFALGWSSKCSIPGGSRSVDVRPPVVKTEFVLLLVRRLHVIEAKESVKLI